MAIPSGSGTEVLKRAHKAGLTDTEVKIIDGVADHIYTVLSVIFTETANASENLWMKVQKDASQLAADTIELLHAHQVASYTTFVYSDKIVLSGTDELVIFTNGTANVDVWVSYIDQDWT